MPWLDLLTEQDLDFGRVLLGNQREDRVVDCVEHLCGISTDVIEVDLEGVGSGYISRRKLLAGEPWSERHFEIWGCKYWVESDGLGVGKLMRKFDLRMWCCINYQELPLCRVR